MTPHQARRFFLLWMPVFIGGVAMLAASANLTNTMNGLTILGAAVALAGIGAAAYDDQETRHDHEA